MVSNDVKQAVAQLRPLTKKVIDVESAGYRSWHMFKYRNNVAVDPLLEMCHAVVSPAVSRPRWLVYYERWLSEGFNDDDRYVVSNEP